MSTNGKEGTQPIIVFVALLMTILVMRGPITCIGAVADEIIESLQIGYPAYGFLSALPIACFGLFCDRKQRGIRFGNRVGARVKKSGG